MIWPGEVEAGAPALALQEPLRIVAMGGGTGLPRLLAGLAGGVDPEDERAVALTAVVTVADDGGSSGELRRAYGVPAPGDVRNCLVALASGASPLASVFQHRFTGPGSLAGHTVGNVVLTALAQRLGGFGAAVEAAAALLGARGRVVPATPEPAELVADLEDGREVAGESAIAAAGSRVVRVRLEPEADAPGEVLEAIHRADLVVLGPGSLYSSVIASALPAGVADALASTAASRVLVVNLRTQPGESDRLSAADHVRAVQRHLGDVVDVALLPRSAPRPAALLEGGPVDAGPAVSAELEALGVVPFTADLADAAGGRHDPRKLARALLAIARAR